MSGWDQQHDQHDLRLEQLKDWAKRDPDIKRYIWATCREAEADSVDELSRYWPVTFEELYDTISTMVEDLPIQEPRRW